MEQNNNMYNAKFGVFAQFVSRDLSIHYFIFHKLKQTQN